jgi:aspartyl-tRNA synthetase
LFFINLRERAGITQLVFDPNDKNLQSVYSLRDESVLEIWGTVSKRPADAANNRITTGAIEVSVDELIIHNICDVLPFPIPEMKIDRVSEDLRLTYRYLDLRRQKIFHCLQIRHLATCAVRNFLDQNGFLEIETPYLFKTTPEGAREFLVPGRLNPGHMCALSQSPNSIDKC